MTAAAALDPASSQTIAHVGAVACGKRVVFVSGNFNVLHPGHLRLLRFAKECGDYLVVGVNDARSPGAFLQEEHRLEGVQAIHWVDHAFVLRDRPADFVTGLKPAVVVKGKEHEEAHNEEEAAVAGYGGKLRFGSGDVSFSSLELLRQESRGVGSTIRQPKSYLARHGITPAAALAALDRIRNLRVAVIGDTIVDEYVSCDPLGMSQEDPTIVVTPIQSDRFVGGAGIVAAHARRLGGKVEFFSVLGKDDAAGFVRQRLGEYGVDAHLHEDDTRPTTLKQRFRAAGKTLLRVSHLRQHDVSAELRERLLADVTSVLDRTDLVIFADFNYGCLPSGLVDGIRDACARRGVMMTADSQSSSQTGDVSRFLRMKLVTPTEREARLALQDFDSGLVVLAQKLMQKSEAENVVVTLGAEGLLVQSGEGAAGGWPTDRLPALNTAAKDPAGAGDSFLTTASMALAVGADIWLASYLGSIAAAVQVGRVGNLPLSPEELSRELSR
ncbi:MAG: PfkB family carbohydrate kinase [Anaeromyxobacter sp.]